jgi:integrase
VIDQTKGGKKRAFAIEIYPSIEKLLREFTESGDKLLWQMPAKQKGLNGLIWMRFFREINLPHLCFHCTRVTFITRGARAGVPESAMMKLVNHASKEVHRIYQRLAPADALRMRAAIPIPSYGDAI